MPAGCVLWVQQSVSQGYGQPLACAAVLQSLPISCHFRGCKTPLFSVVSDAISGEIQLPLPVYLYLYLCSFVVIGAAQ